jgi:type IX secretion system PorP/SprF family membrane protein
MDIKNILKSFLIIGLTSNLIIAQDIHFSQYSELGSAINPALAGVQYDTKILANYRTQWGSISKSYQTYGLCFEQTIGRKKLKGNYFTVIFNVFRDRAGEAKLSTLNPNLGLAFSLKVNKTIKFSTGLQGGFNYKTINVDDLKWDKQYDGYTYNQNLPTGESAAPRSSITKFDIGGGINFSYAKSEKFISAGDGNKFNAGISFFHFNSPQNSFITVSEKLDMRSCLYFNGDFNIPGSKQSVVPSFLYMRQGTSNEFVLGMMYKFILVDQSLFTSIKKPSAFSLGLQYRYKDAVIPCILYQYDKCAIGLSYDINVSALTPASKRYGGLEVMLRYNMSTGYGKNLGRGDTKASY